MASSDQFSNTPAPSPGPAQSGPPRPGSSNSGQPYQFTDDELRVLRECNRDSFFQRCLPLGTLLGTATFYAVKTGHIKPSARWGSTPKVFLAVIFGYFVGKISYQTKCAEKLMLLPDSRLGAILRQRKRGTALQESLDPAYGTGVSLMPFSSTSPSDTYSDVGPLNSMDLDTTRPEQNGLDDTYRPSVDNPVFEEDAMPPVQKKSTSYDELRKRNREDYQNQRTGVYKPTPANVPSAHKPPSGAEETFTPAPPRITNKYGDFME